MATSLTSVLIIYTGGTIGMAQNPVTGALEPFNFHHLLDNVPELRQLGSSISTIQFEPPIDSSEIEPSQWERLVYLISENYDLFDGFVVLHGTDTMAYTASAVSFMLENLSKPVIFTGSQLPVGVLRTDGKENLITAIEIASAKHPDGSPVVPEVCIFFENSLMRGNRTRKISAENFNAFASPNYPLLAQAGVHISYDESEIRHPDETLPLKAHYAMDNNIAVLKLYPGISRQAVHQILGIPGLKGVVMETFGAGNAPKSEWFLAELREAIQRGIVIVNVTQCNSGSVQMGTTEAAIAKLMFLFGHGLSPEAVAEAMNRSFVGEITIPDA